MVTRLKLKRGSLGCSFRTYFCRNSICQPLEVWCSATDSVFVSSMTFLPGKTEQWRIAGISGMYLCSRSYHHKVLARIWLLQSRVSWHPKSQLVLIIYSPWTPSRIWRDRSSVDGCDEQSEGGIFLRLSAGQASRLVDEGSRYHHR